MSQRKAIGIILVLSIFLAILFILSSLFTFRIGFPLDDAWIHQTFARNLAQLGEWSFNPGQPAAGSTSPLWTMLLSVGFLLHIPVLGWTFLLGTIILFLVGYLAFRYFARQKHISRDLPLILACLVISEWHLVWAATSGMETLLQAFLFLFILLELNRDQPKWMLVGVLTAISFWTRPDGLTVLGPILLVMVFRWGKGIRGDGCWKAFPPIILFIGVYLYWNYLLSGSIWPNTYYAKQVEYGGTGDASILIQFLRMSAAPLAGFGAVVLPGFVIGIVRAIRNKDILRIAIFLWIVGYIFLYAWKLPVVYQHGRYVLPVLPIYLVLSLESIFYLNLKSLPGRWPFIFRRTYQFSIVIVCLAFLYLGGKAYGTDVAIIESEMVDTARWVSQYTRAGSLIAAHDIGALGYFSQREVLDLAGLVEPSVIPIIRNQAALAQMISERDADYLVLFPGWYDPPLPLSMTELFRTEAGFAPSAGGENLRVYQLE